MDKAERMKVVGELYKKKKPLVEIAEMLGVCVSTVSNYIAELGLKEIRAETTTNKIMKLHYEGYTYTQIAYELHVSVSYAMSVLRENGIGRHYSKYEDNLINENTVFAKKKKIKLEKEIIDGKSYTVINPLLFPDE